uniref:Uncharacterized protein n=1 Tax=Oryza nivara TaxID=4536 RepID=A0A0E0GHA8_ORYNI
MVILELSRRRIFSCGTTTASSASSPPRNRFTLQKSRRSPNDPASCSATPLASRLLSSVSLGGRLRCRRLPEDDLFITGVAGSPPVVEGGAACAATVVVPLSSAVASSSFSGFPGSVGLSWERPLLDLRHSSSSSSDGLNCSKTNKPNYMF